MLEEISWILRVGARDVSSAVKVRVYTRECLCSIETFPDRTKFCPESGLVMIEFASSLRDFVLDISICHC